MKAKVDTWRTVVAQSTGVRSSTGLAQTMASPIVPMADTP